VGQRGSDEMPPSAPGESEMAVTEKATEREPETRRRRPPILWVFLAGAIALFLLGGAGGSYQGKLSEVQKNDNAAYLPGSAESTKVDKEVQQFDPIQTIPRVPGLSAHQRAN
jgi:putative drug exporter of the RND superfamily